MKMCCQKLCSQKICTIFRLVLFASVLFFCAGCSGQLVPSKAFGKRELSDALAEEAGGSGKSVSFACWNTQTFFDAVLDGTEYSDFQNQEKWTSAMYEKRLERLCEVMVLLNSDIIVLEEIENNAVVQDIVNRLASGSWDSKKSWQYTCFAKETGTAIGCAVFSRYKISEMLVHTMDIRVHETKQPSERPIMQVTIKVDDADLVIFVNHWKSKSGGEEETEIWRDWQESLLAEKISEVADSVSVIACGDFNRSAEDFITHKNTVNKTNVLLRGSDGTAIEVFSPWLDLNGKYDDQHGSYFYKNSWERIDNIFAVQNAGISRFSELNISPVADEEGKPVSYKMYNETGYSDHLPLKCVLTLF